jgi:uncharacterized protein
MVRPYNSYNTYLRERFSCRVHKVSVDVGFTCPNRDGSVATGGCLYCNNNSFVPRYARSNVPLGKQINAGMEYIKRRFKAEKFIIYFQAYTNTYDKIERLERLYSEALGHDDVVGLAIGTRSDCVDEEKIKLFEKLSKDWFITLEYGIESIYDKTLELMNRGHNYQSVLSALQITKGRGIHIGAHIIVGFPGETSDEMLGMADEISRLDIDFLKIHNLNIVRNTPLARMFAKEPFNLFTYEEYLHFISRFIERLSPKIVLERFFTDTPKHLLVAPIWNKTHGECLSGIEAELKRRDTYQGKLFKENSYRG